MKKILVVRLSALGDVLMTLPLIRALRHHLPRAELHLATQTEFAGLFAGHPDLDRVVAVPVRAIANSLRRPRAWMGAAADVVRLRRWLRDAGYDLVLDAHGNTKSGLVTGMTGAPVRVGPAAPESKELAGWFYTARPTAPPSPRRHRHDRALSLLAAIGLPVTHLGSRPPASDPAWAAAALGAGVAPVILHPGTSPKAAFKRWPAAGFGELARAIAADGTPVRVVGGPGEDALVEAVVAASGGAAAALPTPPGLPQLGGLLGRARLFVGADSGPGHLAAAHGVPVVTIYGPKDPALYGPRARGLAVVRRLECRPCGLRRCPRPRVDCLVGLAPATVVAACRLMLDKKQLSGLPREGDVRVVRQE